MSTYKLIRALCSHARYFQVQLWLLCELLGDLQMVRALLLWLEC